MSYLSSHPLIHIFTAKGGQELGVLRGGWLENYGGRGGGRYFGKLSYCFQGGQTRVSIRVYMAAGLFFMVRLFYGV